jgi:hypothetical protein
MPNMYTSEIAWYVSLSDVLKHPKFEKDASQELLKEILHDFGMDTNKPYADDLRWAKRCDYKVEVDEFNYFHRSLSGDVVKCPRYVGTARQDGAWKKFVSHFLNLPMEFSGENLR